jgi:hypothetical protein
MCRKKENTSSRLATQTPDWLINVTQNRRPPAALKRLSIVKADTSTIIINRQA